MNDEVVRSPRNQRVAAAARLQRAKDRKAAGLTLLEGPHLLAEAVAAGAAIDAVFALEDDDVPAGLDVVRVAQTVLDRLAPTEHPRGPVAVMQVPAPVPVGSRVVVLHGLSDPGNAGTVIRTAAAFGVDVATTPGTVDVWSPKVLRAAAGAHFHTRIGSADLADYTTVAAVPRGGASPQEIDPGETWALLVGEEAAGLPAGVIAAADLRVTIPMTGGTESLNAAVAAAIVLYELVR